MSVQGQILVAAQTAAASSGNLARSASDGPCTIVAAGLALSETVQVQILGADGVTFANVLSSPASQLTATINTIILTGPGIYKFVKSVTVAAVGVVAYAL